MPLAFRIQISLTKQIKATQSQESFDYTVYTWFLNIVTVETMKKISISPLAYLYICIRATIDFTLALLVSNQPRIKSHLLAQANKSS